MGGRRAERMIGNVIPRRSVLPKPHRERRSLGGRLFVASVLTLLGLPTPTGHVVLYALARSLVVFGLAHHAQGKPRAG